MKCSWKAAASWYCVVGLQALRKSIGQDIDLVAIETQVEASCREMDAWHYVTELKSLKTGHERLLAKIQAICRDPSILKMSVTWDDHQELAVEWSQLEPMRQAVCAVD